MTPPPGAPIVVGVDPGAEHAGVVARRGRDLLAFRRCERDRRLDRGGRDPAEALASWCGAVTDALDEVLEDLEAQELPGVRLVAVELTVAPRGHAKGRTGHLIDPGPTVATAHVGGAVLAHACARGLWARFVPPDRHGQVDLDGMPPQAARRALIAAYDGHADLVGPRATRGTRDVLRHLRSAYDVAGAGATLLRTSPA